MTIVRVQHPRSPSPQRAPLFRAILIANRGEIAVRLARGCRDLGIRSVAVFSDVDRASLHVLHADAAYPIGPAAPQASYLNIERILDVARRARVDAIHPGYGFLSENPAFAAACRDAGFVFIGPSPESMRQLGSKTAARDIARACGVPLVPGSTAPLTSLAVAQREAAALAATAGYPLMLKAAAGGGGKGMRLIAAAAEFASAYSLARTEARNAFGDDTVYLEKALLQPRHIEVQILGDQHGNLVYLGERECSLQRRHQKILEETPAPLLTPELRRRMGEAAVAIARAADYTSAGTVEFLVDAQQNFYFLEMNTRLQVEHPITEMVTGLDLVEQQIRIAAGRALALQQEQLAPRGHAIECRIYAEDPTQNFMPSPGRIEHLVVPAGPGIREDSGIYEGWTVPLEYDPLLSKLIAWGGDRPQAIARMARALSEYHLGGIRHNLAFFRQILARPDFQQGDFDTGYLQRVLADSSAEPGEPGWTERVAAAAVSAATESSRLATPATVSDETASLWRRTGRQTGLQ